MIAIHRAARVEFRLESSATKFFEGEKCFNYYLDHACGEDRWLKMIIGFDALHGIIFIAHRMFVYPPHVIICNNAIQQMITPCDDRAEQDKPEQIAEACYDTERATHC